ncbi:PP2C family protein-serine/threonine phosphatase [Streptomyces cellostaticus]|uniref:PP2C family protein-serine/threonine phosphatase n=1 Tax=Streptomyces cellostaticus TaxID=67285 RepID=UPI002026B1FB|nr:PP2C family protein-serine/threonine phosphatase [Streptomyces cellostaticus]
MWGVSRWIQPRRGPAPGGGRRLPDGSGRPEGGAAPSAALRAALGGIGTTLDEEQTCAELTAAAVRLTGGTAAVLRGGDIGRGHGGYGGGAGPEDGAGTGPGNGGDTEPGYGGDPGASLGGDSGRGHGGRPGSGHDGGTAPGHGGRSGAGRGGEPGAGHGGGDRSGYRAVSGEAELLPDASRALAAAREAGSPAGGLPPGTRARGSPGTPGRSVLVTPVTSGRDHYGLLVTARRGAPHDRAEAELLALLAERAASHIRHARTHDRIRRTTGDLQRALLAEPGRPHPNLDIAVRHLPAGGRTLVGGDWCETVRLHFGRTLLVVGDVMGHGLEAAVDMNAYRSSLRYIAATDLPPHRVLRQMDFIASGEADRRPATCLLARVDPGRGQITLAGAGHLPPLLIGPDGAAALLPVPVGPPLGTGLGGYDSVTHPASPGQTLVLFTDGLVERRGEDIDRSLARLAGLRFPAGQGVGDVLDTILSALDARHAEDDVAVLAARPSPRRPAGEPPYGTRASG